MSTITTTEEPAPPLLSPETYLSISQAARYMGLSRTSIYRLNAEGTLPVSRLIPDAPRIRRSDLDSLLAASFAA